MTLVSHIDERMNIRSNYICTQNIKRMILLGRIEQQPKKENSFPSSYRRENDLNKTVCFNYSKSDLKQKLKKTKKAETKCISGEIFQNCSN